VDELVDGKRSKLVILELIWNLPENGAFSKALSGDRFGWGEDRILLMDVANGLKVLDFHFLASKGVKGLKKPKLWELPGAPQETPTEESLEIEQRMLAKWAEEEAAEAANNE
jgi:hypothetical protein